MGEVAGMTAVGFEAGGELGPLETLAVAAAEKRVVSSGWRHSRCPFATMPPS